ncbi:hypothetical protein HMPREF1981_02767, partial [Bacteroides pyogenes F0041]
MVCRNGTGAPSRRRTAAYPQLPYHESRSKCTGISQAKVVSCFKIVVSKSFPLLKQKFP